MGMQDDSISSSSKFSSTSSLQSTSSSSNEIVGGPVMTTESKETTGLIADTPEVAASIFLNAQSRLLLSWIGILNA
jgi:hypothetical protein